MTSSSFTIPCDAKNGLSAPLVFDTYAVKVQATGNGMVVLGTAAPTMVTLTDPNAAKDLGTVTIPIDAL